MLNNPIYSNPIKHKASSNSLYKGFWDEQAKIKQELLNKQNLEDVLYKADREKAREDYRLRPEREAQWEKEAEEWRRKNVDPNLTGNFFNDFVYGFKSANRTIMNPFNKYVAPVISVAGGPIGKGIAGATNQFSGIVEKL